MLFTVHYWDLLGDSAGLLQAGPGSGGCRSPGLQGSHLPLQSWTLVSVTTHTSDTVSWPHLLPCPGSETHNPAGSADPQDLVVQLWPWLLEQSPGWPITIWASGPYVSKFEPCDAAAFPDLLSSLILGSDLLYTRDPRYPLNIMYS